MAQITFTIDNAKLPKVIEVLKFFFPIPKDLNGDPLFTDNAWAKESVRRWMIAQVKRYDDMKAKEAINTQADDTLVT